MSLRYITIPTLVIIAFMIGSMFWAMGKSRERMQCYETSPTPEQCAPPGWFERLIRRSANIWNDTPGIMDE